ncbi:gliding motility-associated C-terminal domain-containing protein [Parapedobacter lycopersici]|uniref:T9SS type B sorting domain-containing protein n=1 Tax=Parapedobacter lycopersici TaxID=1864939 RepID=UPI00214DA60C|nr:gliding motility-associated C-terminal domain-containing protein [Parapedobacter lycopersici]
MQRIVLTFFFVWLLSGVRTQAQTIIYVSPVGVGNGSSWTNASNIANAIATAPDNAELRLHEGAYNITTTLSITQRLTINGGYTGVGANRNVTANPSVLNGGGNTQIMAIDAAGVKIDGLTFFEGFAATGVDMNDGTGGGAIYISSNDVTITNSIFRNNVSAHRIGSGAIYLWSCDNIQIADCLFENNRVVENVSTAGNMGGGAIHIRFGNNTQIINTVFRNNDSRYTGGAIHDWGVETRFENCVFEDNESEEDGGGLYLRSDLTHIHNSRFEGNQAVNGGGLATNFGGFKISASTFHGNSSQDKGGAIYNHRFAEPSTIERVQFHENVADQGGAVYNYGEEGIKVISSLFVANEAADKGGAIFNNRFVEITNTSFVRNTNTALIMSPIGQSESNHCETTIFNSIFYLNTAKTGGYRPDIHSEDLDMDLSTQHVRRNILQAYTGTGNQVGVNPIFVNNTNDFRLQAASPAIDAGRVSLFNGVSEMNAGISTDLDGNGRNQGANIDMGAYETDPSTIGIPACVFITVPEEGAEDIPLATAITWSATGEATGYRITIGTTSGGTDIVDNEEVMGTTYTPATDWNENTTYFVTVVPFNAAGEAEGCAEISFTTETLLTTPECTVITGPVAGAEDVALDAVITWEAVTDAEGYRVFVGTTSGGVDIVDGEEVIGTTYTLASGWAESTTYYVTVVPFNAAGEAADCPEVRFTTETLLAAPECTVVTSPAAGGEDVALYAVITWAAVTDAEGYRVFVGTTSGGVDIVDGEEVIGTTYTLASGWAESTTYYVTVVPFNAAGEAADCPEVRFTTETLLAAPECAVVTNPGDGTENVALDAVITWEAVADAEGYRVFVGTTSGGVDVADGEEVAGTAFVPVGGWVENTIYYVTVVPFNAAGEAADCPEVRFTTETLLTAPECTVVTSPAAGVEDVALNAVITWGSVTDAEGYRVFVGTTPGGTDVADGEEETGTAFVPVGGWAESTTYYVTIVPFNDAGEAAGCAEISFTTETLLAAPECAVVTNPGDGTENVALDAVITWEAVADAEGYRVFVGTTSGGVDVADGEEVAGTAFVPVGGWVENTIYYVTVVPFNAAGEAMGCAEISFTTETLLTAPGCTVITGPGDGAMDIDIDAAIVWGAVNGVDGYRIYIGTSAGGTDIVDGEEVIGTSYAPAAGWKDNTTYYVTIVPFNAAGEATDCSEISFTTEILSTAPGCTTIISPVDGANSVSLDAGIRWTAVADAEGYRIAIGTTPGGTDVVNNEIVTGTTFNPGIVFAENTRYYLRVTPFNAVGEASGCGQTWFVVVPDKAITRTKYGISPNGDGIHDFWEIDGIGHYPDNTVSIFNRWGDMVFHTRRYDNHSNVFTGVANKLTGLGAGVLPPGTYFFSIQYRDGQEVKKVEGFLVLRR